MSATGITMTVPSDDLFTAEVEVTGGTAIVVLRGELDAVAVPLLARRLDQILADEPQRVIFDMARVGFIDCAAVRTIAAVGQRLPAGRRPVIRSPSPAVRRVLDIIGLGAHVEHER